jgi:hypothetical protein
VFDEWNSRWYKRTERLLPLWLVWALAGLAATMLVFVMMRLN